MVIRQLGVFAAGLAAGICLLGGKTFASESTKWLIENPVSMMDWGTANAQKSAQKAADSLNKDMEEWAKIDRLYENDEIPEGVKKAREKMLATPAITHQFGYRYGPTYGQYELSRDRIVVGVFVIKDNSLHPGKIDAESCAGILEDFRNAVRIPATSPQQLAAGFWFSHNGYKSNSMPKNFENDLANHIFLVVHLDRIILGEDSDVICEEPLAGGSITSVVKRRSD